jgi:ubiquinone/menaquinone biosynthesis C-methylase UbiE
MKLPFLRKSTSEALAVSMAGIKLGDRLLVVGCSDPLLIAQLATKTGLTGRACAVDDEEPTVTRAANVALREGALVETLVSPPGTLPLDAAGFDVVVVRGALSRLPHERRVGCLTEVRRVLRPGGRCLVIDSAPRGLSALVGAALSDYAPAGLLETAGFKAARVLAEREGLTFAEAVNPIPNP